MKKYIFRLSLIATGLILSSCGSDKQENKSNDRAIKVKVAQVVDNIDNQFLAVSGKVQALKSSNLSTRMMGHVSKIHINIGDKVTKDQLLLSINNNDLSAKLAQAKASIIEAKAAYTNTEKDYHRFVNLFKNNSASQKELDDITAHYNMAKARLEAANQMKKEIEAQFSYVNIRAPFNGVVSNKFINEGDIANPGIPLLEIETPGEFQVAAMVPETEISQIKNETKVVVQIKSLNALINGKVVEVSTSAKNTGGQYLVKVMLEKTNLNLLSGMFATVQFPVNASDSSNSILIPISALVTKGELSGIYSVSQSNTALLRWLRLGRIYGDKVEVLSGLNAEESYIISSETKLFNGAKVTIQ
ncbi:efflux RND transporter periplasmic adaptor subunit [Seonamhaeicola aphaedonensis]|uniref:RND family efflux transporter MFP subunit n=1 Tax=Seonamhaeicola aphaedonensis TaxID=1461338 RepID=A0A3D9HD35_9FLAO|nr:efflux RND transporter periplasmic adaptor subunit [Seonamhaeicola aphaedonensis]RED47392.1 RND family efflux transporter MFP subunit [Seonamhaeicola aphaedonensis]